MVSRVPFALCMAGAGSFFSATYQFNQKKLDEQYFDRISLHQPLTCPKTLTTADKCKKVWIKGTIDNSNTIIMGPFTHPSHISNENGSYVYSPLILESGQTVIINQGWLPQHKLKTYYENTIENTKSQQTNCECIVSPKEIEAGLFFEIDKEINNDSKTVKEDAVISAVWTERKIRSKKLKKQRQYLVVDMLDDGKNNIDNQHPYKFKKTDIFRMWNMDLSPKQHLKYAYSLVMTGAMCCGVSYALIKRPTMIKRFSNNVKPMILK